MKKLLLLAAALACAAAFAQPAPKTPAAFQGLTEAGATVVKSFPVGDGLTGWVIRHPNGEHMIAYSTASGQYMVAGAVFDASGANLTQGHVTTHVPKADHTALVPELRQAPAIVAGPKEPKSTLFVFFDINCRYCAQAYKALKPHTQANLQVRYLPVAILGPTSSTKMQTILAASDPAAALDAAENDPGSLVAASKVSDANTALLASNLELMGKFGLRGTPGIVYLQDGKPVTVGGMPKPADLERILASAGK